MNPYEIPNAVILGIDGAKHVSGASILRPVGVKMALTHAGPVRTQQEREAYVRSARALATSLHLPLVVMGETWDPPRGHGKNKRDKHWTFETVLGIGEGWGWWTAELARYGVHLKLDIFRATPNEWRDAVFGRKRPKRDDEPDENGDGQLKRMAIAYAKSQYGASLESNAAESVCLAHYAVHHPGVHARVETLTKKLRQQERTAR